MFDIVFIIEFIEIATANCFCGNFFESNSKQVSAILLTPKTHNTNLSISLALFVMY